MRTSDQWSSASSSVGSSSPSPTIHSNRQLPHGNTSDRQDNQETKEVFQSVFKGRKCWKTQKGGEMVWPPELEAALLAGLAKYQPDNSRETVLLGRYPMRNRFISEYILRTTGKHRTAKQVGSRLQQLRDTCNAKELQHLLSPIRKPNAPMSNRAQYSSLRRYGLSDASSSSSDASLPDSPISRADGDLSHKSLRPVIYTIDIVPDNYPSYSQTSTGTSETAGALGMTFPPRPIRLIDPTLTFTSASAICTSEARSVFRVYQNADQWKMDTSPLQVVDSSLLPSIVDVDTTHMYSTSFSRPLWESICESEDPTRLTVYHNILRDNPNSSTPHVIFSAVYKFRYYYPGGSHSNLRSEGSFMSVGSLYTMDGDSDSVDAHSSSISQDFPQNLDFLDMMQEYGYDFSNHDGWSGSVPTTPSGSETEQGYSRNSYSHYRGSPERFSHCRGGYPDDSSDSLSPVSTTFPTSSLSHYVGN